MVLYSKHKGQFKPQYKTRIISSTFSSPPFRAIIHGIWLRLQVKNEPNYGSYFL